jgi:hypothetical protein
LRGVKWAVAGALGALGLAAGSAVGASGSSSRLRATAAASSGQLSKLDPVLGDGANAVVGALNQGLAVVLGGKAGKGGTAGFKRQQNTWTEVQNTYDTGARRFAHATAKASDEFLNGIFSGRDLADDTISLLRLISGYQHAVNTAADSWDQVKTTSSPSIATTPPTAGKTTVATGLRGATQLIQAVAKAEVVLHEKVAVAELQYEGGALTVQEATHQIDVALAAFENEIAGASKDVLKGAPGKSNNVVNDKITKVADTWNRVLHSDSLTAFSNTPQLVIGGPPVTTTTTTSTTTAVTTATTTTVTQPATTVTQPATTVTQPATTVTQPSTTVAISCPTAPAGGEWPANTTMTVTGTVTPAPAATATVTINYDSSLGSTANTTDTDTTAANGSFTDTATTPTTMQAQSIQAAYAGAESNACAELMGGSGTP